MAPGTYEYTTEIDEKTHKQVGSRGPYDLFTASRSAPICNGHLAQQVHIIYWYLLIAKIVWIFFYSVRGMIIKKSSN